MAVLSIEVLARLVRRQGELRDDLLTVMQIISNNTWNLSYAIQEYIGYQKAITPPKKKGVSES